MSTAKEIHYGTPSSDFPVPIEESVTVYFHNFANLSSAKGKCVRSPIFTAVGGNWEVMLYPRGANKAKTGMVSVYLKSKSPAAISRKFSIAVKARDGQALQKISKTLSFHPNHNLFMRFHDYAKRGDVLDESKGLLNNGTLTLIIRITSAPALKPRQYFENVLWKLFLDEESADIAFQVKGDIIYAHKLILKAQVPEFAELVEMFSKETHMSIEDVDPHVFKIMLKHVYGQSILVHEWEEHSRTILVASGKYGFTDLKLEAEAWYMKNLKLTADNAIDELLYADGIHCILLKKTVIEFIMKNGDAIMRLLTQDYKKLLN
eukprot:scaffold245764_cov84-Cyclotella_meneghiniana.AAC.2